MNLTCMRSLVTLAVAMTATASYGNQLTNGSFESGLAGWTATAPGSVRSDEQPSDGALAFIFDFGNVVGGAVQQTFATTSGVSYSVSFDYWGWAASNVHTILVEVASAGTLLTQQLTASGSIPAVYKTFNATFVASSASATIKFTDLTSQANGIASDVALDRVSVAPVPEPATYLQFAGGLALLTALKSRRRIKQGVA